MADRFDAGVGNAVERMARRLSRRDALRTAVLGGAASVAALTLGQKPALAVTCECGPTDRCSHYNRTCPSSPGCPEHYIRCKNKSSNYCSCDQGHYNWQGYCCEYSGGTWIACTGLGSGHGYKVCTDCLGPRPGKHCRDWCTCLSACVCCSCTTAKDVRGEQKRLAALGAD